MRRQLARLTLLRRDLDRWGVIYLIASGLYPFISRQPPSGPWPRLALHAGLAAAVWFLPPLARGSRRATIRLIGEIYLPFIFPLFYSEMQQLGLVFYDFTNSLDPRFIALEERLFGGQPSLVWSQRWPWPWLHELFEFAYFSYYFFSAFVVVLIMTSRRLAPPERWTALRAFMRDLGATMLVCYTLYTFFPVWGPKYFRAGPVAVHGWIFTRIMRHIHEHGAILGAAFPSSHVAATLIPWWHAWKIAPRSRPWLTTLFVLLAAATVYCRYHYVVDVIGGLLLGTLMLWLGAHYGERELRLPRTWRLTRPRTGA
ncbi:MAG: phosphatase PAP2 family protein [Candidatus Krumholzibacteriia bacterium]